MVFWFSNKPPLHFMEIPIGNKEILSLLVAGNCDPNRGPSLCGPRLKTTSLVFPSDMPSACQSRPNAIGASYYYPCEDFCAWRAQFEALSEYKRWPTEIGKQRNYSNYLLSVKVFELVTIFKVSFMSKRD